MVDVREVNEMDVSRANEFRRRLCSTKELAHHCQGAIEVGFYGYDDDPRELFEIYEVRRYVALLDQVLPELFFFARSERPAATLMLFVFCLAGIGWEGERSAPDNPKKFIVDYGTLGPFLEWHFADLNYMAEWLGLPEAEIECISTSAATAIGIPGS
jgi:hypothetical protein